MSTFDLEVSVMSATVAAPTKEALEAGTSAHVELGIIAGLQFPIANPQTGEPLVIPVGQLRFKFGRKQAIDIFQAALKAAQDLPEIFQPSGRVMTARSMADVEAAHQNIRRASGQ